MKSQRPECVIIEGAELRLRPLRESDAGLMSLYAGDGRVASMTTSIPHPLPPGATEAFLRTAMSDAGDETVWAMDASHVGGAELIGVIGAEPLSSAGIEIGYWVGPPFWRAGHATVALGLLCDHLQAIGAGPFIAKVFQDNIASTRVVEKSGFLRVGEDESFSVARGEIVPVYAYERSR